MVDVHRARKNDYVSLVECFGYRLQSVLMRAFMFVAQNAGGAADAYALKILREEKFCDFAAGAIRYHVRKMIC